MRILVIDLWMLGWSITLRVIVAGLCHDNYLLCSYPYDNTYADFKWHVKKGLAISLGEHWQTLFQNCFDVSGMYNDEVAA